MAMFFSTQQDFKFLLTGSTQLPTSNCMCRTLFTFRIFASCKCKYMIISRKRAPTLPKISLTLMSSPLERVSKFKYLGVWLADNLSWSYHIKETSTKATKMAGMIYRKFYPVCNTATMLQLYVSYIRPLLEYTVPVRDPHTASNSRVMENVQKFSLRMCWKEWDASYDALISFIHLLIGGRYSNCVYLQKSCIMLSIITSFLHAVSWILVLEGTAIPYYLFLLLELRLMSTHFTYRYGIHYQLRSPHSSLLSLRRKLLVYL